MPRTVAAIDAFALWTHAQESQKRPFPDFHHCPFIGLIGPNPSRVGCLLHPLAEYNQGVDFRGLSYYGGLACRTYFCPATQSLPARYKRILRTVLDDWYLYGMVVTEAKLIAAQFQWLEKRLERELVSAFGSTADLHRRNSCWKPNSKKQLERWNPRVPSQCEQMLFHPPAPTDNV